VSPLSTGFTTANITAAGAIASAAVTCALSVNGITALGVRTFGPRMIQTTPLLTSTLPIVASAVLLVLGLASFPILLIVSILLLLLNFSAWMSHDRTAFA